MKLYQRWEYWGCLSQASLTSLQLNLTMGLFMKTKERYFWRDFCFPQLKISDHFRGEMTRSIDSHHVCSSNIFISIFLMMFESEKKKFFLGKISKKGSKPASCICWKTDAIRKNADFFQLCSFFCRMNFRDFLGILIFSLLLIFATKKKEITPTLKFRQSCKICPRSTEIFHQGFCFESHNKN